MKNVRDLVHKRNDAERTAGYSQVALRDDPRIALARDYNAALSQLTDAELDALEAEWYQN